MPNLLSNFTLPRIVGGASPGRLQQYFHGQGLLLEITDFEKLKKEIKPEPYKQRIADHTYTGFGRGHWQGCQ